MEPSYVSFDEVKDDAEPRQPTKMELYLAEVAEFDRLAKKEASQRKAKRKRAKAARKINRKRK